MSIIAHKNVCIHKYKYSTQILLKNSRDVNIELSFENPNIDDVDRIFYSYNVGLLKNMIITSIKVDLN